MNANTDTPPKPERPPRDPSQKSKEQNRLSLLRFLSQTHRREYHFRRRYEWRVFAATVSFYVLSAAYSIKYAVPGSGLTCSWLLMAMVAIVFLVVAAASGLYLYIMFEGNNTNKSIAEAAERDICKAATQPEPESELKKIMDGIATKPRLSDWSFVCECVIVAAFGVASLAVIASRLS